MFSKEIYLNRRQRLSEIVKDGLVVILGNTEAPFNCDHNTYHYRQDSSFLYFFGIDLPGFAGVLDIDNNKDYIFANDVDIDDIIWMGPQPKVSDQALEVGIENTLAADKLKDCVAKAQAEGRKIHFLPAYRAENKIRLESVLSMPIAKLKENVSETLVKAVVELRSIKEECEIVELEKAAVVGYNMHVSAMKMAKAGMYESEVAGEVEAVALRADGLISFPSIVTKNGQTLHNHFHGNKLKEGDLLLVDCGAETNTRYASDNTRTFPIGGKFSDRQKSVYEIVLAGINKGNELIRPGVTYKSIHFEVCKVLVDGLKSIGLMKGDTQAAVDAGAHTLFLPHGLGHMMGMDVHDMEDLGEDYVGYDEEIKRCDQFGTAYLRLGRKLQTGFVITNEPGIYFIPALIDKFRKEEKFMDFVNYDKVEEFKDFGGIRLEDDLLVTEDSCRQIGKRIPITIEEIEAIMAQ